MSVNIFDGEKLVPIAGNRGGVKVDGELSETSANPVQNKVITNQFGILKKEINELNSLKLLIENSTESESSYKFFGKIAIPKITSNRKNAFSVVVCGVGNIERVPGIYVISCSTRAIIQMKINRIIVGNKNPTFGYFESGDYVYFGMKIPEYNFPLSLFNLGVYGANSEVGDLYSSMEEPEGWTEVEIE